MAHYCKCLYCGETFNRDKESCIQIGRRYVHQECYDKRQKEISSDYSSIDYSQSKKADLRVCKYCSGNVDIKREEYQLIGNRYAHKKCYEKNYTPDEEYREKIYSFLKYDMHISYDYKACERQRASYISKGYTNEGILKALKYAYLVKKVKPEKSGNRIGIVPYVYNEAEEYYNVLEKKQKIIAKVINKQLKDNPVKVHIAVPENRKKKELIDIDKIGEK